MQYYDRGWAHNIAPLTPELTCFTHVHIYGGAVRTVTSGVESIDLNLVQLPSDEGDELHLVHGPADVSVLRLRYFGVIVGQLPVPNLVAQELSVLRRSRRRLWRGGGGDKENLNT